MSTHCDHSIYTVHFCLVKPDLALHAATPGFITHSVTGGKVCLILFVNNKLARVWILDHWLVRCSPLAGPSRGLLPKSWRCLHQHLQVCLTWSTVNSCTCSKIGCSPYNEIGSTCLFENISFREQKALLMKWQEHRFRRIRCSKLALFCFCTMTAFCVETSQDSEVKTSSHNEADLSASQKKTLGQKGTKKNWQRSTELFSGPGFGLGIWMRFHTYRLKRHPMEMYGTLRHRHPTNRKNGEHNMLSLEYSRFLYNAF